VSSPVFSNVAISGSYAPPSLWLTGVKGLGFTGVKGVREIEGDERGNRVSVCGE